MGKCNSLKKSAAGAPGLAPAQPLTQRWKRWANLGRPSGLAGLAGRIASAPVISVMSLHFGYVALALPHGLALRTERNKLWD